MKEKTPPDRRIRVKRIGPVTILRRELTGSYYLRVWDSKTHRPVTKSAKTANLEEAEKAARNWKAEIQAGRRAALLPNKARLTVEEALKQGCRHGGKKHAKKSEGRLKNLEDYSRYFTDWLKGTGIRYWDEVDSRLVAQYIDSLVARDVKAKSISHYLSPLTISAKYWAGMDSQQYRPLYIAHEGLVKEEPRKEHLTLDQLRMAIAMATARQLRWAVIGFTVCGMAGLRLRELAYITRADLEGDVLTVRRAKNDASPRTIPVLPDVARFLQSCFDSDPSPYLIHKMDGSQGNNRTVSDQMKIVLNSLGHATIAPKEAGRKTFVNWATVKNVHPYAFDAYLGHAARSMADEAYRKFTVAQFRELVVQPLTLHLEQIINKPKNPAKPAKVIDVHKAA